MTLGDLLSRTRVALSETDTTGFFSDSTLTLYINDAQNALAMALRWPPMTRSTTTVNGTQEYTLPEDVLAVWEVFVAGQLLVPVSLPMLEGWGLELWDDTGTNYQPEWQSLDQAAFSSLSSYPVTGPYQGVIIDQTPGVPLKPCWYPRGANIGLIPTPNGAFTLLVYGLAKPPDLANSGDLSVFPEICRPALVAKVCQFARESERHYDEAQYFEQRYEKVLPDLIMWKENLFPQQERPQHRTYSSGYPRMRRH